MYKPPVKASMMAKKLRALQRKSSPTAITPQMPLPIISKPFEDASFQSVYQRITREMRISIIPEKKKERYSDGQSQATEQKSRRNNTEVGELQERRLFYSVDRSRNNQLTHIRQSLVKPQKSERRAQSTVKFVSRLRKSQTQPTVKEQEISSLQKLLVAEDQLAHNFPFFAELVDHFKRLDSILNQLRHFTSVESIIGSIRSYILDDQDNTMSQFHLMFSSDHYRQQAKTFLFLERVSILVVVEQLLRRKLQFEIAQLRHLLSLISDTYIDIFASIHNCQPAFLQDSSCTDWVETVAKSHTHPISAYFNHNQSIRRRLNNILRHTKDFLQFVDTECVTVGQLGTNIVFYRLLEFYSFHLASIMPMPNPLVGFLATCPSPYLHHTASKEYTLVLDLDETLVHYNYRNNLSQFKIRPYCQEFLYEMSEHFEVGIFTCGMQDYADWVTSHLRGIEFKLYRHHAVQTPTGFIKDLTRLGRDIKRTIILDNLSHNFQLQKENGIEIVAWFGDAKDTALLDVMELLKFVIKEKPEDLRDGLRIAAEKISNNNSMKFHS